MVLTHVAVVCTVFCVDGVVHKSDVIELLVAAVAVMDNMLQFPLGYPDEEEQLIKQLADDAFANCEDQGTNGRDESPCILLLMSLIKRMLSFDKFAL